MKKRVLLPVLSAVLMGAQESPAASKAPSPQRIDLATALRLAGANNLEVQIAREKAAEADANARIAVGQFFPSLSPGIGYRRHEGNLQDVAGAILNADKEQFTAGGSLAAQVDLGEALFASLSTHQLRKAAQHRSEVQRQETVFQTACAYFDLVRAHAAEAVAQDAVGIAEDYESQIRQAADAGLAFKGDVHRSQTQVERNRLILAQAREQSKLAGTRLAQLLRLDSTVALRAADSGLHPLELVPLSRSLDTLVVESLSARPELKQFAAQLEAARKSRQGAIYGPLIPNANAQAFYGGLGGGVGNPGPRNFDQASDYNASISWRIGPGGLFDFGRIRAHDARVRASALELEKTRDEVIRQVVDGHTRIHALSAQLATTRRALESAGKTLDLARERREFGVGVVLETIQSEQDLTRARLDYLAILAEQNKAQYGLQRARGALVPAQVR